MNFEILSKRYGLIEKESHGCYKYFACSVIVALSVRLVSIIHGVILITTVVNKYGSAFLNISFFLLVLIMIDGIYVTFMRYGRESKYFSLCTFLYILACTPPLWILHAKRHEYILHYLINKKGSESVFIIMKDKPNFTLADEKEFRIHENIFMAMLVLSAWFLPKDDLTRDNTYTLMIQNISMAADAHEMFFSSDTLKILGKKDDIFPVVVLSAWTLSLPLFVINTSTETYTNKRFRYATKRYLEKLFGNFYWKYITSMVLMDGPFFMIRIISIFGYQVIGLQNIFYISKNIFQIVIQVSRILGKIYMPEDFDLREQLIRIQGLQRLPSTQQLDKNKNLK